MSAIGVLLSKFVFLHSTGKFFSQREDHRAGATSGGFYSGKYLFNFYSHLKTAMRILSL
nr:MAG TPA: hypothetical protein [Caudoviricetes sp.]